jgi:7,8-dihydroneopterin aldolase/epimerase/oxygenase
MVSTIRLNGVHVYAFHGCWEEEAVVGGDYIVDVAIQYDFTAAAHDDDLAKTIDYVAVKEIIYSEMEVRSKLIETVAHRIRNQIQKQFPLQRGTWVRIAKINAPMGGHVDHVSVEVGS